VIGFLKDNLSASAIISILAAGSLSIAGCMSPSTSQKRAWQDRYASDQKTTGTHGNVHNTSAGRFNEFQNAGPIQPSVNISEMIRARRYSGIYHVIAGDVLDFRMPAVLRVVTPDLTDSLGQVESYRTRVNSTGMIYLPIVGEVSVAGKSIAEIESLIAGAYYPKYVVKPPSVVGQIAEYRTARIAIVGAVNKPGVYDCRSNELSLVNLIMKAEGIVDEGASVIRVRRGSDPIQAKPVILPVKGLAIPFVDIALGDGDTVEVERIKPQVFTVIGLVNRSGTFPYPPGAKYNLLQALAFAGGINDIAAPEYARVYRQNALGKIISASFRLKGSTPADAASLMIKPGDVVAVEHTFSTQAKLFLAQILSIKAGVNAFATYRIDTDFDDAVTR